MARAKQFDDEEVLQRAVDIFWTHGYHATSIDSLVKHLGINRASLYHTFKGKRQLFEKAINKYISDNTTATVELLNTQSSVKEGIENFLQVLVNQATSDSNYRGCFVVNTTTELIPDDIEVAKAMAQNKINFEDLLYCYLKKGQDTGEIDTQKNIEAISKYLVILVNGLKVSAKVNPVKSELSSVVSIAMSVFD